MGRLIRRLTTDRRGGISVEYALAVGLLGVATVLAYAALGDALDQATEPSVVVGATRAHSVPTEVGF